MSRAFIREHYQITLPLEIRRLLPIEIGDPVDIRINKSGEVAIKFLKTIDASQTWFWTKGHQEAEKEAEQELRKGKGKKVKNAKELIDELEK